MHLLCDSVLCLYVLRPHAPQSVLPHPPSAASNDSRLFPTSPTNNASQHLTRSIDRIQIKLNRFRKADRRLFFSFNQFLLSMIAPRLMRYQFDLMMHSVVAELFRKIFVPAFGTVTGAGESSSLLGSLGSLLRNRQTTRTTTAAPNLDVQRLLDNAQKLITLQSLLRNSQNIKSNRNTPQNSVQSSVNSNSKQDNDNHSANGGNNLVTEKSIDQQNPSTQSTKAKSDHPVQFSISSKDFLNFIQHNFKLNQGAQSNYNATDTSTSTPSNAFDSGGGGGGLNNNPPQSSSSPFFQSSHANFMPNHEIPTNSAFSTQTKKPKVQKAKLENFKMSHLTYIDTEVPNYGNQLLVHDHEDSAYRDNGSKSSESKEHLGLLPISFDKDPSYLKTNDDLERANRWNDVLVNMKRFG